MKISYRKLEVANFHEVAKHFTTPEQIFCYTSIFRIEHDISVFVLILLFYWLFPSSEPTCLKRKKNALSWAQTSIKMETKSSAFKNIHRLIQNDQVNTSIE